MVVISGSLMYFFLHFFIGLICIMPIIFIIFATKFLNYLIMELKIRVFNFDNKGAAKLLYSNCIVLHDDIQPDYTGLYQTLRFLYPKSKFIEFCLSTF